MPPDEFEFQTKRDRFDPVLKTQGWSIVPYVEGSNPETWTYHAVAGCPTANGPADDVLFVDGKPLGIIEAKKPSLGLQNVLIQVESYSKWLKDSGFDFRGHKAPFLWLRDVRPRMACSRRIKKFHTLTALREKLAFDHGLNCAWFQATPNNHYRLRPYQVRVNAEVEQANSDSKRQMMVAMATGTGKTFTLVKQGYRLLRSGIAKRVRFQVARHALAAQAARTFATSEPVPNQKFSEVY